MSAASATAELAKADLAEAAGNAFGPRLYLAETYAALLRETAIAHGLLGPREAGRLWERHLLNSVALASLLPARARVCDIGSGAGLPGIPLAIARPDVDFVLLEPMQRRVRFLERCVEELALDNVRVQRGRAQEGISPPAAVAVARAVAPLTELIGWAAHVVVAGGLLLALKGRRATAEVEQARHELGARPELLSWPTPGEAATIVRVRVARRWKAL